MTALGVEGLSKKEKGLMDTDNSVVIAGGREYKGTKQEWEKYSKNEIKNNFHRIQIVSTFIYK